MRIFNSKYFGELRIFEFKDCSNFIELTKKSHCELTNQLVLHHGVSVLLLIFGFIFVLFLSFVLLKMTFAFGGKYEK